MTVHYHKGDLPAGLDLGPAVAVDDIPSTRSEGKHDGS